MTEKRLALRAAAGFAGIVMAASLAAAPALADGEGDRGRSAEAHDNAPGQEKRDAAGSPVPGNGQGTPPEHAGGHAAQAVPRGPARPRGRHAKPKPSARPAKPARTARPARPVHVPANPHAKAGKTTICHATGSATNPYVTITISDNALHAHARHQDGRDLIPAPAGGCPATAEAGRGAIDSTPAAAGRKGTPAAPAAGQVRGFGVTAEAGEAPAGGVLGEVAEGGAAALPPLRETIAEVAEVARRESGAPAVRKAVTGQLPFTGLEATLIALFGALLVLLGLLFRHVSGRMRIA